VTFIDSACLRELDDGKARLAKLARSLVVRRASAVFERVANLSGYRGLLAESQTSDFSAPVTAPDGRTTSAVPVRSAGHDPLAVGCRAPQQPVVSPQGSGDGA
jgi:hypothetical protein